MFSKEVIYDATIFCHTIVKLSENSSTKPVFFNFVTANDQKLVFIVKNAKNGQFFLQKFGYNIKTC